MTSIDASTGRTLLYKRGWRAFMLIAGIGAVVAGFFCARQGLQAPLIKQRVISWLGALLFGGFGFLSVWSASRCSWVRIHPDGRFEVPGWTGRVVLDDLRDYEGFRLFSHNGITSVVLLKGSKRGPMLPLSLLQDPMELAVWLEPRLLNLDLADLERERLALIEQHTSDQDDPDEVLSRFVWLTRVNMMWPLVMLPASLVLRARFPHIYEAWAWLLIDTTLALALLTIAELGRYRHLVTLSDKRLQFRPSMSMLIGSLASSVLFPPWAIDGSILSLPWVTFSLLVPLGLAWLPDAPDVRRRDRAVFFFVSLIFVPLLPSAINRGLSPRPVHSFHMAHVTDVHEHKDGSHVTWRYDAPVIGQEGGSWEKDHDPPPVGTRFQVELARGALGWHWHVANHFGSAPASNAPASTAPAAP